MRISICIGILFEVHFANNKQNTFRAVIRGYGQITGVMFDWKWTQRSI